jgi:hypothetical protein
VEPIPDPGRVPVPQPTPAGHTRAVAELAGQVLPADPGDQHEQDPVEDLAVVQGLAAGVAEAAWSDGQQWLDSVPQLVGHGWHGQGSLRLAANWRTQPLRSQGGHLVALVASVDQLLRRRVHPERSPPLGSPTPVRR